LKLKFFGTATKELRARVNIMNDESGDIEEILLFKVETA